MTADNQVSRVSKPHFNSLNPLLTPSKCNGTHACYQEPKSDLINLIQQMTKSLQDHAADDPIRLCVESVDLSEIEAAPEDVLQLAERKLNVFPFREVGRQWLRLFVDASLASVVKIMRKMLGNEVRDESGARNADEHEEDRGFLHLDETVRLLDRALIMAGGLGREELIHELFASLQRFENGGRSRPEKEDLNERPRKRRRLDGESSCQLAEEREEKEEKRVEQDDDDEDLLPTNFTAIPTIKYSIQRLHAPTLIEFQKYMSMIKEPIVLTDTMNHWPALKQWRKKSYWMRETFGGRRLVPVEIGRTYSDDDWGQEVMPFGDFLNKYILNTDPVEALKPSKASSQGCSEEGLYWENDDLESPPEQRTGYLAQHDLLSQIPSLRSAIAVPDYCYIDPPPPDWGTPVYLSRLKKSLTRSMKKHQTTVLSSTASICNSTSLEKTPVTSEEPDPDPHPIQTNIWFGPPWTISPLHHDPYHNILCQVVGRKYVRLYSPHESAMLYPRSDSEPAFHVQAQVQNHSQNGRPNGDKYTNPSEDRPQEAGISGKVKIIATNTVSNKEVPPSAHRSAEPDATLSHQPQDPKDRRQGVSEDKGLPPSRHLDPTAPTNTTLSKPQTHNQEPAPKAENTQHTIDLSNTSTIDLSQIELSPAEDWDAVYPGLSRVPYTECVLEAGEALYIPVGWWHYVRSCGTGVGVSFWWG